MTQEHTHLNARRRYWWIALGFPVILSLGLVLATIIWIPELPDPVALHWSGNEPDNFGNVWLMVLLILVLATGFGLFTYYAGRSPKNKNQLGAGAKLLGSLSVWLSVMLSFGVGYSLYLQLGLPDATAALIGNEVGVGLIVSALLGIAAGGIAWALIPKDALIYAEAPNVPAPLPLRETETVSLIEDLHSPNWLQLTIAGVAVVTTGLIWYGTGIFWLTLLTGVLLLLLMLFLNWRVTINNRGITITSLTGFPSFRYPIETIEKAAVTDIDPAAEFGGWGFRQGFDGRYGIVIRKGPALHIDRSGKQTFVITMEHAEQAAELINGLIQRLRSREDSAPDSPDEISGNTGSESQ